jgi:hypothetical protein
MANKLSRNQVLHLVTKAHNNLTNQAIRKGKDIPYFEGTSLMIWHNEYSAKDSLRINKSGLFVLKDCFKRYPVPLKPGFQVKNVHIKYLEEELKFPYYLDNKSLVLFSGQDAIEIKLHDGDLDVWARSRWVNDRYQEPPQLPEEEL